MNAASRENVDRDVFGSFPAVDPMRPLPGAGGGLPAFAALDRNGAASGLMAVQVARAIPPRAHAIQAASGLTEGVLGPVGHGPGPISGPAGSEAYYVFCPVPPGPAVGGAPRPWSETELLDCLLRPAVQALTRLAARGVTHRAIRADNVFQGAPGQPVVLGQAWAAPPAALQPAVFEAPYVAMCLPCGRGDGVSAEDVYALGVLMIALALGRVPLHGMDTDAVVRRKLELGGFAAVVGDARLPPTIAELARGMLAEDPEHRPSLALLADPQAARARRLQARPPKRAGAPLRLGAWTVWDARAAAHAVAGHPAAGLAALRAGTIDTWLRRGLGEPTLAGRLEEFVRARPSGETEEQADALLAMRAVGVLDPLAPLCWRGVALWPDGLGPALAAAQRLDEREQADALVDLVAAEAAAPWAAMKGGRIDGVMIRTEARQRRAILAAGGVAGGARRLAYALNPLLPCDSPLLGRRIVVRLADLVPALEVRAESIPASPPVDADIGGFIAARVERASEAEAATLAVGDAPSAALARIELLAGLQGGAGNPAPALARWLIAKPELLLAGWCNVAARTRLTERLGILAIAGQLAPMVALLRDQAGRAADLRGAREAAGQLAWIEQELARIEWGAAARGAAARHLGQEAAAGIGLGALALSLALTVFG